MNGFVQLNNMLLDVVSLMPLLALGIALVIWLAYWLLFGRKSKAKPEPVSDDKWYDELVVHMVIGPCVTESELKQREATAIAQTEEETWWM